VFGLFTAPGVERFIGEDPPQKLSDIMMETWLAFAKNGNPNNASIPHWPTYDGRTRATMVLNVNPTVVNDPYGADAQVWDALPFDGVSPSMPID
jgi:para-nitrobenzyl esterase